LDSQSPAPKIDRLMFETFVKNVLGVTKAQLDARLAEEKRTRRKRAKRPAP
jgi:hypothetical protein